VSIETHVGLLPIDWYVTNLVTYGELWPTFRAKFFHNGYIALFVGAQRNLAVLGVWPIETYSPNFENFGPGVP